MELSAPVLDTIAKLAQLGGVGVGVIVLVGALLIVLRGQPVDPGLAAFRMRTLTLGIGFAFLALVISLIQFTIGRDPGGPGLMTVTYSPSFATENLPTPAMQLIGASSGTVVPDQPFSVMPGTTLKITADQLIAQARSVKQLAATAQNALASNVQLTAALTASTASTPAPAPPGPVGEAAPAPAVKPHLIPPEELFKLHAAQSEVLANLQRGNYAAAAVTSNRLSQLRLGSQLSTADVAAKP